MLDSPTLLIGLGGTGGQIAYRVWQRVPESARSIVGLHIFDTDRNPDSGLGRPEYAPLWDSGAITQTSPNMSVSECVDGLKGKSEVQRWFPLTDTIGQMSMTDGAMQVRVVSRLAWLDTLTRGGLRNLDAAIEELHRVRPQRGKSAFRVLLINTLAGGTGSGLFLQVALYIRNYLVAKRGRSDVTIRNLSLLPGIFLGTGGFSGRPKQIQSVQANAYASVKELQAVMVARHSTMTPEEKRCLFPLELEYLPSRSGSSVIDTGAAPFETIFLLDRINAGGQSMTEASSYIEQAIDTIYLQLISPLEGRIAGQTNNLVRAIDDSRGRGRYASMGVGTLRFPYEDIIRYLALRWAAHGLDDQWLSIDRQWRREVEEAKRRQASNPSVEIPTRRQRYVEVLEHRARAEPPHRFFLSMLRSTQKISRDAYDQEVCSDTVSLWTAAVRQRIAKALDKAGGLQIARALDPIALKDPELLVNEVAQNHAQILRLHKQAEARVTQTAQLIANDILWEDATQEPHVVMDSKGRELAAYRLNTWLLQPGTDGHTVHGLHPVAIRYFLYRAYSAVDDALSKTQSDTEQLVEHLEAMRSKYDNPKTPVVESVVNRAEEVKSDHRFWKAGNLKDFADRYERESREHIALIQSWAATSIEFEALKRVRSVLESMIADWERFFDALDDHLAQRLRSEIAIESRKNESANPMELSVLGSAQDKERFWSDVHRDFSDDAVSPEICARLYIAHFLDAYERHIDLDKYQRRRQGKANAEESLFKEHVVAWCEQQLRQRSGLRLDIITALQKEWQLSGTGDRSGDWILARIAGLRSIVAPWLPEVGEGRFEQMEFWGLPSEVKSNLPPVEFGALFEGDGGNPVVSDEFSPFEIKRFVARFAMSVNDIPDFKPDSGSYAREYRQMRDQTTADPSRGIPVHIDKRWDSPAFLREIDDAEQDIAAERLRRGVLYGILHDEFVLREHDRQGYWAFVENQQTVPLTLASGKRAPPTLLGLFDGLAMHFRCVDNALRIALDREDRARSTDATFSSLPLPDAGLKMLRRLVKFGDSTQDSRSRQLFAALLDAFCDEIACCALRHTGLDQPRTALALAEETSKALRARAARDGKTGCMGAALTALDSRPKLWRKRVDADLLPALRYW
jgi:hypothetical protein